MVISPARSKAIAIVSGVWMSVPVAASCGVGAGSKVNWSAALWALVPFAAVTVISIMPAGEVGGIAVIDVSETTVNEVASEPPKCTAVAPVKFVPVMVTAELVPAGIE